MSVDAVNIENSDIDSATVTETLTVSNPGLGSLSTGTSGAVTSSYNAGTGVWSASGVIADVDAMRAGEVTAVPACVNPNFTIATSVSDGALSVAGNKAVTGIAVNDPPTA